MSYRVLLADDQAAVRSGLRALLELPGGIVVVGEARHGAEAIELAGHLRPDVVLMDVRMPTMDGITATAAITSAPGGADHASWSSPRSTSTSTSSRRLPPAPVVSC